MPKHPPYAPVPRQPDDIDPADGIINPDSLPIKDKRRRQQVDEVRDKALVAATIQQGLELKQRMAARAESRMTQNAGDEIATTVEHLDEIRSEPGRSSWAQKKIERATDQLADDTERRTRGLTEGVSREITEVARKPLTPNEIEEEPTFLERLLGPGS